MRKRFTAAERAAFTPGAQVEWRNVSHWHPGTVTGPAERVDGWDHVPLTNHANTRTVSPGQVIHGGPTFVRLLVQVPVPHCRAHLEFRSDCNQCASAREFE